MKANLRGAVCASALVLVGMPLSGSAQAPVGIIKVAQGEASVVRGGTARPATPGLALLETDTLRTGSNGRLGVTLHDDTRLSLGPDSELRVSRYRYAPAEGALGLVLDVLRGAAIYVSGQIAKLSPDSVRLETPSAIVGVRGTTVALRVVPR